MKLRRLAMENKRLKDVLPKLAQMMAKDFSDFSDEWEEVLKTYAEILEWLSSSRLKSEDIEKVVVEVIERYIEKRRFGPQWNAFFPAYKCLAFELGEIPFEMFKRMFDELEREIYGSDEDY
jgi:hypothetical protein